jgi:hypothetical protein
LGVSRNSKSRSMWGKTAKPKHQEAVEIEPRSAPRPFLKAARNQWREPAVEEGYQMLESDHEQPVRPELAWG